ncbi:uncharacterized protein APUU_40115A [Aspergillus puulaauensis]|uniref:SnoaL-like domain-containing protein n=1 Tax=Aspergillus puulaauensis TaxID=1220207 RepID=A0A7R7XLF3_9EURO|nr:uncharacterized protein APUU_40115A [Aspergillus puulaauensis]BCS23671.1 hypothetical protein APUU_40115A [Aspergillus puulaauensis]
MGYPTGSTIWPISQCSDDIKKLVDRLFTLADTKTVDAGDLLAQEVFSAEGQFLSPQGTFTGSNEIRESRKNAWTTVKTRYHVVSKVYINDTQGTDLIIIGSLSTEALDTTRARVDFVARMVVETTDQGARVRQYRVITPPATDPRPLLNEL